MDFENYKLTRYMCKFLISYRYPYIFDIILIASFKLDFIQTAKNAISVPSNFTSKIILLVLRDTIF